MGDETVHQQREQHRLKVEARAIVAWFRAGKLDQPDNALTTHYAVLFPHEYGAGCCGFRHYVRLANLTGVLATYRIVAGEKNFIIRRIHRIPDEIENGTAMSIIEYYKFEDNQGCI